MSILLMKDGGAFAIDASGRLFDERGIDLGQHARTATFIDRPVGPWDHNTTAADAHRDADASIVALVGRHPGHLSLTGGKLEYSQKGNR